MTIPDPSLSDNVRMELRSMTAHLVTLSAILLGLAGCAAPEISVAPAHGHPANPTEQEVPLYLAAAQPTDTPGAPAVGGELQRSGAKGQGREPGAKAAAFTCPMHPEVQADVPGKCPICGMQLVRTKPEERHDR
jgi:hypothetical protein